MILLCFLRTCLCHVNYYQIIIRSKLRYFTINFIMLFWQNQWDEGELIHFVNNCTDSNCEFYLIFIFFFIINVHHAEANLHDYINLCMAAIFVPILFEDETIIYKVWPLLAVYIWFWNWFVSPSIVPEITIKI